MDRCKNRSVGSHFQGYRYYFTKGSTTFLLYSFCWARNENKNNLLPEMQGQSSRKYLSFDLSQILSQPHYSGYRLESTLEEFSTVKLLTEAAGIIRMYFSILIQIIQSLCADYIRAVLRFLYCKAHTLTLQLMAQVTSWSLRYNINSMFYVMFSGGETDAQLIINDFLTSYVTGTKYLNVNQADYRSCICLGHWHTKRISGLPSITCLPWIHVTVNIFKQGVQTQLNTLLGFNIYTFH